MAANDLLEQIKDLVFATKTIVSCPQEPMEIPGIGAGSAYESGDAMGSVFEILVPKSGIIYSATLFDMDDEGKQIDLEIFKHSIAASTDNSAWSPADETILVFVTELNFFAYDDQANSQTSENENIGKAYNAPEGKFYIQAVTRGTHNIAAGSEPRVQLQIMSFDPDFEG